MMHPFFEDLLERLAEKHREIEDAIAGLPHETLDWSPGPGVNSFVVLIVHLTAAERYWIGDVACGQRSGRDRDAEFRAAGLAATDLQALLRDSLAYVGDAMAVLTPADLAQERISWRDNRSYRVGWALAHALEHTALHAGHIQVQRQWWDRSG